jgi:hypothetical protein
MSSTIAQMTKKEFSHMLSTVVEQKLTELFGDPDQGLLLREPLRKRLSRQRKSVAKGNRGDDFNTLRKRLGLWLTYAVHILKPAAKELGKLDVPLRKESQTEFNGSPQTSIQRNFFR